MTFPQIEDNHLVEARLQPPKRFTTDIPGAVDASGLSRAQLYKDMRSGKLVAHKNGNRTLIFLVDLERYLRALPVAKFRPVDDAKLDDTDVDSEEAYVAA
jgi:hypothetical protein